MKKFRIVIGVVCAVFVAVLIGINLYMNHAGREDGSRQYRVSVNRLKHDIEEYERSVGAVPGDLAVLMQYYEKEGYQDILAFRYVLKDELEKQQLGTFFMGDGEDYVIIVTDMALYRVSYERTYRTAGSMIFIVNSILIALFLMVLYILYYVYQKILKPFNKVTKMPYELSKGNIVMPLTESKNRFFGRFLWGMDLLREHIEEQKERELSLQREKKMLLMSLSHDVKTPLSAIKLYAKALERNLYPDEEKKTEIVSNIGLKTEEIERYISEIVKASNEDFLHFEVQNREFYIGEVLEQIREYYADKMELNRILFRLHKYSNCMVYGDADRVVEVLQNIVENAIKYGDGKRIEIGAERDEEAYVIRISNSGCKLEQKELPHIFDSFYRGSNAGNRPGSGLGLYICRELVHRMDGEIMATMTGKGDETELTVLISLRLA